MPNAIRVKCKCGTTFRSSKLRSWEEEPEPRLYQDVEQTQKVKGVDVTVTIQVEVPTFRGRHHSRYSLCRACARKPMSPVAERRLT